MNKLKLSQAKLVAEKFLATKFANRENVALIKNQVMELEFGWIMFYDSEKAIETGNFRDRITGNYPLLVNRFTSEVLEITVDADKVDDFLEEYYLKNSHLWKGK